MTLYGPAPEYRSVIMLTYQSGRGPGPELKSWVAQIHTATGEVYMPKPLGLGPVQQLPKHGDIVRDMDM